MPRVTYIQAGGQSAVIDAAEGISVMQAAVSNGIPGIEAVCGGACACATCHVYVDPAWADRLTPASDDEAEMLACTASERRATSRLSCQIEMTAALDGLVVHTPETQS